MHDALIALLPHLACAACGAAGTLCHTGSSPDTFTCRACATAHPIRHGVLHASTKRDDDAVVAERAAVVETERLAGVGGINDEFSDLAHATGALKEAILALPYGNDSRYYREPGYFANVAAFAPIVDYVLDHLGCVEGERVLDIGADLTWSTSLLASRGYEAVAIDINHHLPVASLFHEAGARYACVNVDMNVPLFLDGTFDGVTAFNALHHSGRLDVIAHNIARVLKPHGRLGIVEPYCLDAAAKASFGAEQCAHGVNEHVYLLEEWHAAFSAAGLELVTFSLTDSFNAIYRKRDEGRRLAFDTLAGARDALFGGYYRAALTTAGGSRVAASAGSAIAIDVQITNHGAAGWSSRGAMPVFVSYHLWRRDAGGESLVSYDNARSALPGIVLPATTVTVPVPVIVPHDPGDYVVEIDLVHEGQTWFVHRGVSPVRVPLTVQDPGQAGTR